MNMPKVQKSLKYSVFLLLFSLPLGLHANELTPEQQKRYEAILPYAISPDEAYAIVTSYADPIEPQRASSDTSQYKVPEDIGIAITSIGLYIFFAWVLLTFLKNRKKRREHEQQQGKINQQSATLRNAPWILLIILVLGFIVWLAILMGPLWVIAILLLLILISAARR